MHQKYIDRSMQHPLHYYIIILYIQTNSFFLPNDYSISKFLYNLMPISLFVWASGRRGGRRACLLVIYISFIIYNHKHNLNGLLMTSSFWYLSFYELYDSAASIKRFSNEFSISLMSFLLLKKAL